MLASWFDPSTRLGALVAEPDLLLPAMLRPLRFELMHYPGEAWVSSFIANREEECP